MVILDENGNFNAQDVEFNYYNETDGFTYSLNGTISISKDNTVKITSSNIILNVASPYDVSEANGYIPDAYKNGSDSWNTVVLTPNMDVLKISIVNEKGEMLNDE